MPASVSTRRRMFSCFMTPRASSRPSGLSALASNGPNNSAWWSSSFRRGTPTRSRGTKYHAVRSPESSGKLADWRRSAGSEARKPLAAASAGPSLATARAAPACGANASALSAPAATEIVIAAIRAKRISAPPAERARLCGQPASASAVLADLADDLLGLGAILLEGLFEACLAQERHVDARRAVHVGAGGLGVCLRLHHLLDQAAGDVHRRHQRARLGRHLGRAMVEGHGLHDRERDAPQAE